jgi:hypothetical protein
MHAQDLLAVLHILPPIQSLKPIFFLESQTMLNLTKFLSKIIDIKNTKLITLDR